MKKLFYVLSLLCSFPLLSSESRASLYRAGLGETDVATNREMPRFLEQETTVDRKFKKKAPTDFGITGPTGYNALATLTRDLIPQTTTSPEPAKSFY